MTETITLAQARAAWWQRQALAGTTKGSIASLLGGSGWLRTLGGADVYLAARARRPNMKRGELDTAVAAGELRVMPAARGCIYLVAASAAADLLALNAEDWRKQTEKELGKIGKKLADVEKMTAPVLAALAAPLTTDAIRKALPAGSIPSFGEAGKKVGLSSPLPLVLRLLEFSGRIERTLEGGKLDSDRYLWRKSATAKAATPDRAAAVANMLGAFLAYAGPVSVAHVAKWSGLAQRDVKPVLDALATSIEVEGMGTCYVREADLAATRKAPAPKGTALLAFEDNYLINHGGLAPVSDPRHHAIKVAIWGSEKPEAIGDADHVLSRTIVVDGLMAGFWEVDPKRAGAVWHTFDPAPKPLASKLDELTGAAAKFLLEEIGHAKVFTLDTMDEVQMRADRIAKLRAGSKAKKK
jgi:hypothetical protein